ncbi:NAD(P)-binding protein [Wolfiporia cocos MD-104 SS10]|uniref:NAD(P)-binding protein n=1 Tax=Wolfiporia cocos (strain MD-104) TaxID=742152 RepID=A0A2H3JEU9_WOLCO|nr:NAD(P)-binding protein [Wolfiporia cocos MD-104 SS10]
MMPPSPKWSVDQIPDLEGKVMIVTGGYAGIGKETTRALVAHNAKVYIAGRSAVKAEAVIEEFKRETGRDALFLQLDLADLGSVKAAAEGFMSKETRLHALINNAAAQYPDIEEVTPTGHDMQFGTNVVGHFYLTKLLLPLLLETAKSSPTGKARVVHVSSVGHEFVDGIDFDTLKDGPRRRAQHPVKLYFQSKFANVAVADEFHRRYAEQGLVSCSLHPGNLKYNTERHKSLGVRFLSTIVSPVSQNPVLPDNKLGALTQLWAATMPEGDDFGGKYLIPWARMGRAKPETDDPELGQKLWAWLEEQVKDE